MGLRCQRDVRRLVFGVLCLFAGCSQAVMMASETDRGGVVTYVYKADRDPMFSRYRTEALERIKQKCASGYTITREGPAKASQAIGAVEGQEDSTGHRWGLQFTCKHS